MKLLVITQKVDKDDSNLGFFHVWLQKLSEQVDHLYVICLQEGSNTLNKDKVTILSLGKETGASKLKYVWRFYKHIWKLHSSYDGVFVHMNPEYAILGGPFWRLWRKKVLLWYTHKAVNARLWLAEKFVTKIFTASKESFRLPSKKVEVAGHGIPVEMFAEQREKLLPPDFCLLSVGRITPSKDLETTVRGTAEIQKQISNILLSVVGESVTLSDQKYKEKILVLSQELGVRFGIRDGKRRYEEMPGIFQRYHLLVHTSNTGSMDKVVLEALAAGRFVVTSSEAYQHLDGSGFVFWFPSGDYQELAKTIEKIYKDGIVVPNQKAIEYVRKNHNLDMLIGKILAYFSI